MKKVSCRNTAASRTNATRVFHATGNRGAGRITVFCAGVCMLFALAVVPAGAVTGDSTTWEGAWEGDVRPYDGGAGQFGVYWFDTTPPNYTAYEIANTAFVTPPGESPNLAMNIYTPGALWYTKAVTFDLNAGASVEWRFKSYFGTANAGQDFLSLYDPVNNKNVYMNLQYPDAIPTGRIDFLGQTMAFAMSSSPGNAYHTFRMTAAGGVANLYIDHSAAPVLTTSVGAGAGYGLNGLEWGDKLMVSDFDYIRWTTQGAFAPPTPEPSTVALLALGGLLASRRRKME